MTIFYNKNTLHDTLIINLDNQKVDKIEPHTGFVILKNGDKIQGINIFNASEHFKNLKDGELYPTPEILAEIRSLTGYDLNQDVKKTFVVAEIIACEDVPDSHLHKCSVDVGEEKPLQIICGAKNARQGIKVVCALVGTIMPNGMMILPNKLLNIDSYGMLCSAKELNLDVEFDGILELDEHLKNGETFKPVFKNL